MTSTTKKTNPTPGEREGDEVALSLPGTTISARVVADSVNPVGDRITTWVLTYPRFIHSELLTHRVLSRNAASSRAIPVRRMLAAITEKPAGPIRWGSEKKGMQAGAELTGWRKRGAEFLWWLSRRIQTFLAGCMASLGVHKQIVNRLVEPFATMTTLVTATDWGNFFNLRADADAQPEFSALAFLMLDAYEASVPKPLPAGAWHLPFADRYLAPGDGEGLDEASLLKIVTARAARVSYLNFEGEIDHAKDYDLHDKLAASGHWSPFEHAARALPESLRVGNFKGWFPYRKTFSLENRAVFDPNELRRKAKESRVPILPGVTAK